VHTAEFVEERIRLIALCGNSAQRIVGITGPKQQGLAGPCPRGHRYVRMQAIDTPGIRNTVLSRPAHDHRLTDGKRGDPSEEKNTHKKRRELPRIELSHAEASLQVVPWCRSARSGKSGRVEPWRRQGPGACCRWLGGTMPAHGRSQRSAAADGFSIAARLTHETEVGHRGPHSMPDAPSSPRSAWRRSWIFIGAELLAVVFGIFFCMWANDLQQDSEVSEFVARSRSVILRELEDNYAHIEAARVYHIQLLPALVRARDATREGRPLEPVDYRGLGAPLVTTASYETALSAGTFARVDPEEATAFASAYEQINSVRSVIADYRLALAISQRDFFELTSTAFGSTLYVEDAALHAIAPLIGREPPPPWTDETSAWPF